ncbi:MAG: hypothetical protein ABQ298_10210 [Puniceicoccaceae bacterium]
MNKQFIGIATVVVAGFAATQLMGQVESSIKRDLDASIAELNTVRETIKNEKIPLAAQANQLEGELREKRRDVERVQRLRDNASVDISRLEDNVKGRREQIDYMSNLVAE